MGLNYRSAIYLLAVALFTTVLAAQEATPQKANLTGGATAVEPAPATALPVAVTKAPHFVPVLIFATDSRVALRLDSPRNNSPSWT